MHKTRCFVVPVHCYICAWYARLFSDISDLVLNLLRLNLVIILPVDAPIPNRVKQYLTASNHQKTETQLNNSQFILVRIRLSNNIFANKKPMDLLNLHDISSVDTNITGHEPKFIQYISSFHFITTMDVHAPYINILKAPDQGPYRWVTPRKKDVTSVPQQWSDGFVALTYRNSHTGSPSIVRIDALWCRYATVHWFLIW